MQEITFPYRIFSVDPATGLSGWSVLDLININPLQINIVAHGAIDGGKLMKEMSTMKGIFSNQFCTVEALEERYAELITLYKPHQVVSEGTYGHLHLAALISLTLAINALRKASRRILNKDLEVIAPTITKKAFTGSGGADKDLMRWAYRTHDWLHGKVADDQISEHEIDAVAHGVAHVRRDLIKDVVQLSGKEKRAAKRARAEAKKQKQLAKEGKA